MSASLEAEVLRLQLRVARLEGQADRPISLSIRQVVRAVSLHFNIPDRVLLGDARARHIVLARHVAMHLCHHHVRKLILHQLWLLPHLPQLYPHLLYLPALH